MPRAQVVPSKPQRHPDWATEPYPHATPRQPRRKPSGGLRPMTRAERRAAWSRRWHRETYGRGPGMVIPFKAGEPVPF